LVNDIGWIRALHEEVDFILIEKLSELRQAAGDHYLALGIRRRQFTRDVARQITKMLCNILLICLRYEPQGNGFHFVSRRCLAGDLRAEIA
jgi:hypothetical protein